MTDDTEASMTFDQQKQTADGQKHLHKLQENK